ncbi:MAG: DUF2318 domain-containing protein [Nitrospirae bacterium]|nr:DUF2318 domain-containing protein [Nitrospirota bacterium]
MRLLLALLCLMCILTSCTGAPSYIQAPFNGYTSEIDVGVLMPRQPMFYSLSVENKKISFFLVKVNGEVQAYFNACRECYPKKMGFRVENGHIKCRSCNEWFPVESLQQGIGSCYPIPLKGELKGAKYVITKETLLDGVKFF